MPWSANSDTGPSATTLVGLLDHGIALRPGQPAIIDLEQVYSFQRLHGLSNAIAHEMVFNHGVNPGDRVIVLAEKSVAIVATAIACWAVGAIYVPVDPDNPIKRLNTICNSIAPSLIIGSERSLRAAQSLATQYSQLSYERCLELNLADVYVPGNAVSPQDPAVIIHTSGSTGTPKGVVLSHESVIAYFKNHNDFLQFNSASVGMNNGPFFFDVSIQDTFLPLFFGASVVFHKGLWVSAIIISLIRKHRVTHLIAVSSVLELISKDHIRVATLHESELNVIVTGGEICSPRLINRWLDTLPGLRVLYGYGPTEVNSLCTTNVITRSEADRTGLFSIGKPFRGHTALLLDDAGLIIDTPGVVGTLAIGGPQLMLGYWNDPELTQRVTYLHAGVRYYISGDRCFRDAEGNYYFEGRTDAEVKIRGRRINLNEVRNALIAYKDVAHAVVITAAIANDIRIAVGVQVSDVDESTELKLREWVAERVPEYMSPWYIGVFETPSKMATGKIDERTIKSQLAESIQLAPDRRFFKIC